MLAESLAPGLIAADSLGVWLSHAAAADMASSVKDCPPVMQSFRESFLRVAERVGVPKEIGDQLAADLDDRLDPASFATRWLRRRGLRPLADVSAQNPLRAPGVHVGSPQQRALARYIPLIFPFAGSVARRNFRHDAAGRP